MKNIYFIIVSAFIIIYMVISIRRNKLSISNSFLWIIFCTVLLFLSIFPKSLDWLARLVGISYPPALFLTIAVVILFIINFSYSKRIEDLQKKVIDLAQELSIIKDTKNEKKG